MLVYTHHCHDRKLTQAVGSIQLPCVEPGFVGEYPDLSTVYTFTASSLSLYRAIPTGLLGCSRAFTNLCSGCTSCPASYPSSCPADYGGTHPTPSAVHCSQWPTWSITTRCVASYNGDMGYQLRSVLAIHIPLSHAHQNRVEPGLTRSHRPLNPDSTRVSKVGLTLLTRRVEPGLRGVKVGYEVWKRVTSI